MVTWIKFLLKIINYSGVIEKQVRLGKSLYQYIDFSEEEKKTLRSRYVKFNPRQELLDRIRGLTAR